MNYQFNLNTYKILLSKFKASGFKFITFDKINSNLNKDCKFLLLRHDIDGDLEASMKMAKIEYEMGITSTYFLMWRSPCYNLMSRFNQRFVENTLDFGHQIGLHYDHGYDVINNISSNETSKQIKNQINWMQDLFKTKIYAISFHQPMLDIVQKKINCGRYINTYDIKKLNKFKYISDSNRKLPDTLKDKSNINFFDYLISNIAERNIQLLIHPMWWVYDKEKTTDVWNEVLKNNLSHSLDQLYETERAFGREREINIVEKK